MFGDIMIPWLQFPHVEHANEVVHVRADGILAVSRGNSGVNIHMVGGGVVAVRGTADNVRAEIDAFLDRWDDERARRYRARDEARNKSDPA